jgi:hypothetical protein
MPFFHYEKDKISLKQNLPVLSCEWTHQGYRSPQSSKRLDKIFSPLLLQATSICHLKVLYKNTIIFLYAMSDKARNHCHKSFLQRLWPPQQKISYATDVKTAKSKDILTQFSTTLRPLTFEPDFWEIFHRTGIRKYKIRGCQNFVSTNLQISVNGSWARN